MMKKYIFSTVIVMIMATSGLAFASNLPADFTGERFFRSPIETPEEPAVEKEDNSGTIPPLKLLRLKAKYYFSNSAQRKEERAKKKEMKKALKAYKKNKVLQDAQILDVPTDADIEHLEMAGVETVKSPQRIVITCDDMDYSTETAILNASGNVKVKFVLEDTLLTTDYLVYDKRSNHITAIGHVVINRDGIDVHGESISVDLNEENALIDKPISDMGSISISAERGYVYKNKIIQEKGSVNVNSSIPIKFIPHGRLSRLGDMMVGENDKSSMGDFIGENAYRVKVSSIILNSDKKLESIELRRAKIYHGKRKILSIPWIRLYTNKNHDFVEGDFPEIGSSRNLGMYVGPGWVVKLPFGSVLKLAPILTYKSKFGIGGFARFLSGTNNTYVAYGTSKGKFLVQGVQRLDDHLRLEYAANEYMDNWFLGQRMPKYGASLVYEREYNHKDFFNKGLDLKFTHNASFGIFQDAKNDRYYKKIHGTEYKTVRGRYMAEVIQTLYNYKSKKDLLSANFSIIAQGSAAIYGNGDTQFIGRVGPRLHTQYKRWMQDFGYYQSAYQDGTPLPVFDAYRYGRSNMYLREYLRLNKYLTLSWMGSVTFSDDKWNNNIFQECTFFVSLGPDDLKINVGYDVVRENAYVNFSVALDPKGTVVDYDKLEVKNPENFKREENKNSFYVGEMNPEETTSKVLKQAIIEEIDPLEEETDEL